MRFALAYAASGTDSAPADDEALVDQILDEAGRFAVERLIPLNLAGDRAGAQFREGRVTTAQGLDEAYRDWAAAGWMGVATPPAWGGAGLSDLTTAPLDEIWNGANMAFYVCPTLVQAGIKLLLAHGTQAQKEDYVPNLASGRWTASMGLTEPQAGSDLSLITSQAELQPDGSYLLRGAKIFTSFGEHEWSENIINFVLARIKGAPAGSRGISLFIVPKWLGDGSRNDVVCTALEHKLGLRASPTCAMAYGSDGGAKAYLLGQANAGLATMFVMMNKARIACALQSLGVAERALQQARAYAASRVQGRNASGETSLIVEHPDVRRMLLRMDALTMVSRILTYATVAAVEGETSQGLRSRGGLLTPIAKVLVSEAAMEVTSLNIQVHGGMGYVEETGASQFLRDARAIPIYEGTNGIQAVDLMIRKVVPDGGEIIGQEIARIRSELAVAKGIGQLEDYAARVEAALGQLERAIAWAIDPGRTTEERLAAASPFMTLAGQALAAGYVAGALAKAFETDGEIPARYMRAANHHATFALGTSAALAEDVMSPERILS